MRFYRKALSKGVAALLLTIVLVLCTTDRHKARAQSEFLTPDSFVEDILLENLPIATTFAFAPDNKIFIALKDGIVRVVQNGSVLPTPFVDISAITNRSTDRGLLGLAIDPDFPTNPYVYLLHVYDPPDRVQDSSEPRVIRLLRMVADASKDYSVAQPDSTEVILGKNSLSTWIAAPFDKNSGIYPEPASCMTGLTIDGQPVEDCMPADARSHSAGTLLFGPNRSLYVSVGDGSNYETANRPALRAQMLNSLAGKILRIDPDTGRGISGNPFFDPAKPNSNRSRVWSYGLRNPFRITLNPATGQVFAGDVGSSTWEEINSGKGANFGWPCYEGGVSPNAGAGESGETASLQNSSYANFSRTRDLCQPLYVLGEGAVQSPTFSYAHQYVDGKDMGGSATGVAFYTGRAYPAIYRKSLFIADYALRWLRYLSFDDIGKATVHNFAREVGSNSGIVDLKAGPDTNIYALYLDLKTRSSQLRRFRFVGNANIPPRVAISADPETGSIPLVVTFRSDGTFDPDGQELSYTWDFGDGKTSQEKHPQHMFTKVGTYTVKLTVTEKTAPFAASSRSTTIRTGVTPPKAYIDTPLEGATYTMGDTISFSGRASFNGQSDNPDATLSWAIIQHHNDHTHLEQELSGSGGSFRIEEHADNTWYELCLQVSVDEGLEDQTCREIFPRKGKLSLLSDPVGAKITYVEEQLEVLAPHTAYPIVGSRRSIIAQQIHADRSFAGWDDGATNPQRSFMVSDSAGEYKATYRNLPPVATINVPTLSVRVGQSLRFDAIGSSDPEKTLLRFLWDFGDDTKGSGDVIQHSFRKGGTYTVTLTVEDKLGANTKEQVAIVVTEGAIPTATSSLTPTLTPTATNQPSVTPLPSPTPTRAPRPTPVISPSPTIAPTKTPDFNVFPRAIRLSLLTRNRVRCLSASKPCRIRRGESLRLIGTTSPQSIPDSNRLTFNLRIKHIPSKRSISYPLPSLLSLSSQTLPSSLFSRSGLYSVRLRAQSKTNQPSMSSGSSFVLVRG